MKVSQLMCRDVVCCSNSTSLAEPARIMWDCDVGFVPVIDPDSKALSGVVTDRDICMAAYTTGRALNDIPVRVAMQTNVFSCSEADDIDRVHTIMREQQLRRVPVVDADNHVIGVVGLNDLARHADRTAVGSLREMFLKTVAAVCHPRHGVETTEAKPAVQKPTALGVAAAHDN